MQNSTASWVVLGLTVLFCWSGYSIQKDATAIEAQRVRISLKDLRQHPARERDYWRIEHFKTAPHLVSSTVPDFGTDVWVPLYSADLPAPPDQTEFREILYLASIDTKTEIDQLLHSQTLDVTLCTTRDPDTVDAFSALRRFHYPKLRTDNCRLLLVSKMVPTQAAAKGQFVAAGGLAVVWLFMVLLPGIAARIQTLERNADRNWYELRSE